MMHALAGASMAASGDRSDMKAQPFVRRSYDLAALLMRVRVDAAGGPLAPSSRGFWARVVEGAELPADPARILREAADDRPIDAAWLAGLVGTGDMRLRAERLDQFAFGQRVFAAASPAEMPDVFVAVRAFRRYHMLMVTFERIGISKPATYAAAARLASRLSLPDPVRQFVALAQFQGALALLDRMRRVGSLDAGKTEALVNSLLAVPLNSSSQYLGGLLQWMAGELGPALPPGSSLDAAVQSALAGPDTATTAPIIEWERRRYRVDLAAAERRRLERVREKQGGVRLDLALELASAARKLASTSPGPLTPGAVQGVTAQLKSAVVELSAPSSRDGPLDTDGFPPGVGPPSDPRDGVINAINELGKLTNVFNPVLVRRAVVELVDAADEAGAQALVSLAYAVDLGDPDGAALLAGDVSRRHDFGFGQRDTD